MTSDGPHLPCGCVQVELLELLDSVVAMYGTQLSGCFHFEAKYSPKRGAVPIELNLRIGNAETYTVCIPTCCEFRAAGSPVWLLGESLRCGRLAVSYRN